MRVPQSLVRTPSLVPYIDFPVEHADDAMLRRMGRNTTWDKMEGWVTKLRDQIPDIVMRTSIIVGHPGESEQEFETMMERLSAIRFERMGVFAYSPEEETRALNMKNQVGRELALDRRDQVQFLADDIQEEWYDSRIGKRISILLEEDEAGWKRGRTIWDAPEVDGVALCQTEANVGEIIQGIVTSVSLGEMTVEEE